MNMFKDKKKVVIIALFCCVLWGSAFPVLKKSYELLNLSPSDFNGKIAFAGMRFFIASCALFMVSKFGLKLNMRLSQRELIKVLVLGLFNTSLMYFFFYNGLANTSGIKAAILQSISTFLVVIASHFVYQDDKINVKKILGLVFGFLGIVLININAGFGGFDFKWIGEGFMIFAGISGTIGTLLAKSAGQTIHPFKVTTYQMMLGSIVLLVIGFATSGVNSLHFNLASGGLLLYAAFISATAFSLWFMLLKDNKASEVTLYKFTVPIVGSFLSAVFIPGENFSQMMIVGLVSVSMGLFIVNYKKTSRSPKV